jgi:hypothetical protein
MARELAQLLARRGLPGADRVIPRARYHVPPVGREGHRGDLVVMPGAVPLPPGGQVPQVKRAVVATHRQGLAVGGERQGLHGAAVALELVQLGARGAIPEADQPSVPPRRDRLAVRRTGDAQDLALVLVLETAEFLAGGRIPDADGVVEAARDHGRAVGREGDGADVVAVPEAHGAQAGDGRQRVAVTVEAGRLFLRRLRAAGGGPRRLLR